MTEQEAKAQQVQQAFIEFLATKYNLKSQKQVEDKIAELGEGGLKKEYAEFEKVMKQQASRKAMFGAKLNYIKGLKGQCPSGYEVKYYQKGGRVCAKCEAIKNQTQSFMNPIDAFKCGRKMKKKACGGKVKEAKCGSKVEMSKCGSKVEMDKCGKKMKKKQEGGEMENTSKTQKYNIPRRRENETLDNGISRRPEGALILGDKQTPRAGSRTNPIMLPEITVTPEGTYPSKPINPFNRYTPNYNTWKR